MCNSPLELVNSSYTTTETPYALPTPIAPTSAPPGGAEGHGGGQRQGDCHLLVISPVEAGIDPSDSLVRIREAGTWKGKFGRADRQRTVRANCTWYGPVERKLQPIPRASTGSYVADYLKDIVDHATPGEIVIVEPRGAAMSHASAASYSSCHSWHVPCYFVHGQRRRPDGGLRLRLRGGGHQ